MKVKLFKDGQGAIADVDCDEIHITLNDRVYDITPYFADNSPTSILVTATSGLGAHFILEQHAKQVAIDYHFQPPTQS